MTTELNSLYVVGGQQREPRKLLAPSSWYDYHQGLVLEVSPASGAVSRRLEYVSPPELRAAQDAPMLFKCASLVGDRLYLSTHSEVLVYSVPAFERVAYVSHPYFNDVHHARPTPDGNLLVANTGLDMVIEITLAGEVVRLWNTLGESPWERFSPDVDYRAVASTKPHRSHPNQTFYLGDEPWVTRFEQKDAISLVDPSRRIDIGVERLHDGVVANDKIYFTSVKGDVVIADANSLRVEDVVDLTQFHPEGTLLGWCRGLLADGPRVWIGFSHIRPTRFRENIGWVAHGFRRSRVTHLGCYDLVERRCVGEVELESHGLDAVFSIFAADPLGGVRRPHAVRRQPVGSSVTA